jgi:hypothetical protein
MLSFATADTLCWLTGTTMLLVQPKATNKQKWSTASASENITG